MDAKIPFYCVTCKERPESHSLAVAEDGPGDGQGAEAEEVRGIQRKCSFFITFFL